jgi:hypothetical protein
MPQKGTEQPNATTGEPPYAHFPEKNSFGNQDNSGKNVRLTCMFVWFNPLICLIGS